MNPKWITRGICALALLLFAAPVMADPAGRKVSYKVYNDPAEPESGVRYKVTIELAFVIEDSGWTAWEVLEIRVSQFDEMGEIVNQWIESLPEVRSYDNYWWIDHQDPEDPQTYEFTMPPEIAGLAPSVDTEVPDLAYTLEGVACDVWCSTDKYVVPTFTSLRFQLSGSPEPDIDEDEEPVETEDDSVG